MIENEELSLKKLGIRTICAAIGLSLAGSVFAAVPANAVSERNFMLISTRGAPIWKATATLYSQSGAKVYTWNQSYRSGGKALWYFTWNGDNGYIGIEVTARAANTAGVNTEKRVIPLNRDSCFLVDASGFTKYTGDDTTGCTPN